MATSKSIIPVRVRDRLREAMRQGMRVSEAAAMVGMTKFQLMSEFTVLKPDGFEIRWGQRPHFERCPECGGCVVMPCLLCQTRKQYEAARKQNSVAN